MTTTNQFIDCDSHVTEPPELWASRVSSRWGDLVPHVETIEDPTWTFGGVTVSKVGTYDMWMIGDTPVAGAAQSANPTGRWHEPLPSGPKRFSEIAVPAAYDATARLAEMDEFGIVAQVVYPNIAGFGAKAFRTMEPALGIECVRAYNDFLADWVAPDPRRFVKVAALPYWDIPAAVAELERTAQLGFKAVLFPGAPQDFDAPFFASKDWDPLWSAAQDARMSVSLHAGSGNFDSGMAPERVALEGHGAAWTRASTQILLGSADQVTDLVMSGILPRFPELTFVAVESGIGWAPFVMETCDYVFHNFGVRNDRPEFELLPSEYFRRQVKVCFWYETSGPQRLLDCIGEDNVLFETDFPHSMCLTESQIRYAIDELLEPVSASAREKILYRNAMALYGVDLPVFDAQPA